MTDDRAENVGRENAEANPSGGEFYLDLNKNRLNGDHNGVMTLDVGLMVEGVELGHDFPAVDVSLGSDGSYRIENTLDGGHHRAVAHYIAGKPLKCNLVERDGSWWADETYVHDVRDSRLYSDCFPDIFMKDLDRFPDDVRTDFLKQGRHEIARLPEAQRLDLLKKTFNDFSAEDRHSLAMGRSV